MVAATNEEAANNDKLRVSCFTRTGSLMNWAKSVVEKLINPQGVTSQIATLETHASVVPVDHESSNVSIFIASADILLPKNDIGNSDIHE